MKKIPLFFLCLFLLFHLLARDFTKNLPDLALESFETLFSSPFFREVFDLDKEEAIAVFGDATKEEFV